MKKVFAIFIITLISIILFFNCKIDTNISAKESSIEEIKILQEPYKTKYKKGERLDLTGLVVVAVYSDGSEETITDFTTFPAEGEKLDYVGTKEVAIRKDIKKSKDSLICFAYFNIEIEEKTKIYNPAEGFIFVEGETITGSEEYSSQGNGVFTEGKLVTLNDFYMCDHEVMQGEYEIIMGKNPSIGTTNTANEEAQKSRPVENISWYEAIVYCNKLSLKEGLTPCYIIEGINDWNLLSYSEIPEQNNNIWDNVVFDSSANGYRLPTEEEWEFAARGGKSTYGTVSFKEDSGTDIALVEWNKNNSDGKTHEVRRKSPNALGLFDMGGNVRELCWDSNGSERIVRGGNYLSSLEVTSFLERNSIPPYTKDSSIGMRITRSVIQESSGKSFTINYVSAYGQKPADIIIYDGNVLTGRNLPELSCKGYEFLGWYTSNSFEEETRITSGYIVTEDLTLYAKWIKVSSTEPQPESAQIRLVVQYPTENIIRVKKGDGILFEGVVSTNNGSPTITISRQGEDDENEVEVWRYEFKDDEGIENTVSGFYDFSYSRYIPETWFSQAKSQQYRVIIRADNGKIVESEKNVLYDVDGPEINITDIKPVIKNDYRECINKKITVKGFITDKFDSVDSASWALVKRDDNGEDVIIDSGNGLKSSFTFEADTGNYDYTDAFLRINAYDRAGNKTTKDLYYYIDQSTDIPTIQPNDPDTLTFDLKSKQALVETNNAITDDKETRKNFYTGNSQVLMKFTDDDGIDKITVSATVEGQSEAATSSSVQAKNATEYTYAYKAPESEGYYRIDVVVTDKNGGTNRENFCILVSGETPSLKLTTSPEYITTNIDGLAPNAKTAFTIIGTNGGSAPFKKVIRCQDGEAESDGIELAVAKFTESAEGKNDASDKKRWVDTFIPESSNATGSVRYVLYDAYGITAEETFYYKVDSVRPVARIISCLDKYTSSSGTFRFVGTASDNEAGSGVARVQIRIDNYDEEVGDEIASYWSELPVSGNNSTGWIYASGTDNWNALIAFSDYPKVFGKEGQKVLYVRVEDAVGNYNTMLSKVFIFDTADPFVSIDKYTGDEEKAIVAVNGKKSFEISQNFSLNGTIFDKYGIDNITVEQTFGNDTITVYGIDSNQEDDEGNWSWHVDNLPRKMEAPGSAQNPVESGKYTYKVTVTDKAGKQSSEIVTVSVDITPPTITIDKPIGNITNADGSITKNFLSSDSYMFQGRVVDNEEGTGVDKYFYYLTTEDAEPDDTSAWSFATSDIDWSFAKTIADGPNAVSGYDLYEGEWKLYVKAVDKAGNESNIVSREFSIDKAVPVLTVNTLETSGTTYFNDANYSVTGTATDTHGIESVVIKNGTTAIATISSSEITNNSWSTPLQLEENTGLSLSFTATDKAGRQSETITRSVYRDTQPPSLWITSDLSGLITDVSNGVRIQGSVNDGTGCGVNKILYSIDGSEPSLQAAISDQTWTINLTSANLPAEGMYTLKVKAVDKLGNKTETPVTGTFAYDIAKPTITVKLNDGTERTVTNNNYTNPIVVKEDYFTISGTFNDTGTNVTVSATLDCSDETAFVTITQSPVIAKSGTWILAQTRRSGTQSLSDIPDGIYEYTITALDDAGAYTGSAARKESIRFRVIKDTIAPTVSITTVPDKEDTKGNAFTFAGTASDASSGIAQVELTIADVADPTKTKTVTANGTENWSSRVIFNDSTWSTVFGTSAAPIQGSKQVTVKATDKAGDSAITVQTFIYDVADPILTVDESGFMEYMPSTGFTISGSVADNYRLGNLKIIEKKDGVETAASGENGYTVITSTGTSANFSQQVPLGNVIPTDGVYSYQLILTDDVGHEVTSKTYTTAVDTTAPAVTITNPISDTGSTAKKNTNAINEAYFRFTGNIAEANSVQAVWYKIVGITEPTPTAPVSGQNALNMANWSSWANANYGSSTWNITQAFKTKGATGDGIEEGNYKIYVYVVDKAGNVSTEAVREFDVDMAAPTIETKLDGTILDGSMTQTKTGSYTFKYKITETYGLDANNTVITMKKDNVDFTGFTQSAVDVDGYVTVSINSQADGLYEYTISANDLVGKNYTIRRNILLDTTPPTLSIISPDLSGYQNTLNVKVNGSSEDKSGTQAVWYSFGADSMPAVPSTNTTVDSSWTSNGWTKATGTTSWSFTVIGVEGTDKNLYIAAVDANGAVTTGSQIISAVVKVDITNPTLTENELGFGTQYKNTVFTLTGTVSDAGSGLAVVNPIIITDGSTNYNPTVTSGTWIQTITPASDGEYTFTIKATDNAGRESTLSRTVIYDTVAPTIKTKAISTSIDSQKHTVNSTIWYSTSQIPVVIEGSDGDANGSGVSTIECSTDNSSWNLLSRSGSNYVGTISCTEQGENTIYIRVTDNAGNTNTPANDTLTVNVDTGAPTAFTLGTVQAGSETPDALEGIKLVNGRETVTFTGTATDNTDGCGIASVKLTKIGSIIKNIAATNNSGTYSITIPVADMPSVTTPVSVIVTVTDNAGNSAEFTAFQMQLDNTYPLATVGNIADADKTTSFVTEVNGTITVSGTASDTHTLTGIQLQYQTSANGTSGWSDWTDYIATSNTTSSYYNWSYNIDTTESPFTDETYVRFRAVATDEAGNTGNTGTTTQYSADDAANNKLVKISQYTDRPVIRFTNLNLGTNPIWLKNTNTILGLISDDDGDVTSLKYKLAAAESWITLTPVAGSGYFEIFGIADGQSTFYFQTTDATGKTFTTDTAASPDTLNEPILTDGTNKIDNGTVALNLKVDRTSPSVRNKQYQVYNTEATSDATYGKWGAWITENDVSTWTPGAWSSSLVTLGGKYTGLKVKLEAADQNAIASVASSFGGNTVDFTCSETHDDGVYHPWVTGEISIPNNVTEVRNLEVVITDNAGITTTEEVSVAIDNAAPVITIYNPSSLIGTAETIRGNVATSDVSESREAKLYYAVSRYDETEDNVKPTDSGKRMDGTTVLATAWTEIQGLTTTLSWYVCFDDQTTFTDHTVRFARYLTDDNGKLGITTNTAIANGTYNIPTDLYFWIKAVDSVGNTSTACKKVTVDPQGDRPSVTLTYPANMNGEIPMLGGTIRLSGTATDNEQAKYVWVQIDKDNDGTFDATDLAYMNTNDGATRTYGYKLGQISTNTEKSIYEIEAAVIAGTNISDYGIMVEVQGSSWNTIINSQLEYSPTFGGMTTIQFIIYATDEHRNKSLPVTQTIRIDADSPVIVQQSLKLVQYERFDGTACTDGSVTSGTIANEIEYSDGMDIRGKWFLTGEVSDPSGIKEIFIDNVRKIDFAGQDYMNNIEGIILRHEYFDGNENNYYFQIPMGNDTDGQVGIQSVTLKAVENTANQLLVEKTFSVKYDNKAPEIITTGSNVYLDEDIVDSSGFHTLGAVASEDNVDGISQSGVDRIAFYFTRDLEYNIKVLDATQYSVHSTSATQTHDLFDVMISSENKDNDDTMTGNTIIDYASDGYFDYDGIYTPGTMKSNYVYEDYLIWEKATGTISGQAVTLGSVGKNVHVGGLVKIKGGIYKITGIAENTINISGVPGDTDSAVQVLCAVAGVVDSTDRNGNLTSSTKGYGYGYYLHNSLDFDHDLLVETFNKQGRSWIWDVAIKSTNIPDGPVTVHIVAMDKAGNASEYKYNATVSNNGPRIAGMKIGTDEDGDGTVEYDECDSTYSNLYVNGRQGSQKVTEATFPLQTGIWPTSAIKAKGQVEIIPEIIGGNGALSYIYDVFYRNAADDGWNTTADFSSMTPRTLGTGRVDALADIYNNITISVEDFVKTKNGAVYNATSNNEVQIRDGNNHKFSFNICDNTPARESFGDSQSVTLDVIMDVALGDYNAANNYILPFYWNSASSNSLFGNSKNNGHIELAKDWVFATDYDSTVKTGEYDSDPKVSGKIKIEGIAQDDTLLKEIKVQFNKSMGGLGTTDTTIATYNDTGANAGTWTTTALTETTTTVNGVTTTTYDIPSSGWASEIQRATYGELLAAHIIEELPTIGYTTVHADDLVPYASQQFGHVVHWILYLDTAYVQDVAATDVTVIATATDKGKPTWNESNVIYSSNEVIVTNDSSGYSGKVTKTGNTVTEGEYTGKYKMDIVPYISSVTTALTNKLKSNMKTAYSRTALGHYIARSNEIGIIISGFNLESGTVNFAHASTDTTNYTTAYNASGISIPANARSGEISVTVNNTIETLNNKNNNNASGGTEVITEESLYETKNTYAYNRMPNRSNNQLTDDVVIDIWEFDSDAAKPNGGELREPVMKINPVTGKVGVAFSSGSMDFAMPGNTTISGIESNGTTDSTYENTSPSTQNQYSYSLWQNNYAIYNNITLAFDTNGYAHATAIGLDTNPVQKTAGKFSYFYNRWGRSGTSTSGNYDGLNAIRLESIAVPAAPASGTGFTINGIGNLKLLVNGTIPTTDNISEKRFYSTSLVTTVDEDNTAVYLAYCDSIQGQIRFRYNSALNSTWSDCSNATTGKVAHHLNDKDQFVDNLVRIDKTATANSTSPSYYDSYTAAQNNSISPTIKYDIYYESKTDFFSLIAGADYQQGELREQDNAGNSGRCLTGYDTGYSAGKFVAIDAISKNSFNPVKTNDVVVAVWYDGEKLRYAYNDNPTSGLDNGTAGGWKGNKVIFADGGEHCAIKVDPLGGIHIAAYVEGSLRYAYLSSYDDNTYEENYNSPTTNKAVIVDSFTITGERITIDTGLAQVPGTTDYVVIPYISYYNSMVRLPAVAHPVLKSTMDYAAQGTVTTGDYQIFTGDWEVSLVPSPKTITTNSYDKINLGLWKRAAVSGTEPKGMIVTSLDSGFTGPAAGHTSGENESEIKYGHIYGNGTKNPIMGYAVETSSGTALETAQMR